MSTDERGRADKTPRRSFRISESLYEAAATVAQQRHEPLADVVRRALVEYVKAAEIGGGDEAA